jgi:endonuclease I
MNKTLVFLGTLFCFSALFGQTSIDDARSNFSIGQTVTIKGVAADDGELGPIRYIQDATGGIPVYGSAISGVNRGDSVIVTGELKDFNGLLEVDPISNVTNEGPGVQIAPWNISIPNLGETFEGRLVQFDDVTFPDAGGTFAASTNYDFTDGTNTGQLRVTPDCGLVGQAIPSGAQSLVGLMSQYISNYQVLPRDANDIFAYIAPDKKIEVEVDGAVLLNNETAYLGTATTTPIVLKNLGVNNLTISSATITGANAGDFSTDITAGAIAGGNQTNNIITFTSGGNGSRQAVLEIVSDDPDNPNFIINLYAIGNDNLASEPTSSPAALQFSNVNPYTMSASFDAATDAEQYIVVWKEGSAPTSTPTDGTEYLRGDIVGDGQVAYIGTGNSFTPRGIIANTDYYFSVYAFNGYGQYVNYNQTGVLSGNESSTGEEIGTYYNGISSQNATLIDDLTVLINPHTFNSYFQYKSQIMDQFEVKDTVNGESYVVCAYSGERKVFPGLFDWQTQGYSREHTYAHSWMPTFPADGQPNDDEYTDYHNLYPTNLAKANSPRSNLPFDVITGSEVFNYLDGSVGYRGNGDLVYEPREAQKGNLARAIFYMATCYNGANGTGDDWSIPSNQYQEVLKDWHFGDLPDNYEIARHELIYDLQDNRNPYIDSVDFACFVDFTTMNYEACGNLSVSQEDIESNLVVFPNPSNDIVYVQVNGMKVEEVNVIDMMGRSVQSFTSDKNAVEVNVASIPAGSYFIEVVTEAGSTTRKIIVK